MVEGEMDDGVGLGRAGGEARGVFERAAIGLDAGRVERLGALVRAGEAEHAMADGEQFGNEARADEAGRAGEEYAHGKSPLVAVD